MLAMARKTLALCAAIVLVAAIVVSPSNAAAMVDCEDPRGANQPVVETHDHDFEELSHWQDVSDVDISASHDHPDRHCASHACVTAISHDPDAAHSLTNLLVPDGRVFAGSLVEQDSPQGLRRPPRA